MVTTFDDDEIPVAVLLDEQLADELVDTRRHLDRRRARWLAVLAEFDRRDAWQPTGNLSTIDWLVTTCGLSRTTAKEHLRVARQLTRRPLIARRYATGELSYSKLRAITRITDLDDDTDRALLAAAEVGTAADLDRVVRHWELLRDQDDPAHAARQAFERTGLRVTGRYHGVTTLELTVLDTDAERLLAIVDTEARAARQRARARAAATADQAPAGATAGKAPAEDTPAPAGEAPTGAGPGDGQHAAGMERTFGQRRADALVDLLEAGLAYLADYRGLNPEAAMVIVLADADRLAGTTTNGVCETGGGRPISTGTAQQQCCDNGIVRLVIRGRSEIVDVGRKTRQWTTAARRAVLARHHHQCAIAGCGRAVVNIHHVVFWSHDGPTDTDLALPQCGSHHYLIHHGWHATYNQHTGVVTFTNPDHTHTLTTHPIWPHTLFPAA